MALAEFAARDLEINGIDVVKAFTLSKMDEKLYVEQPHGFEVPGKVCLLNQALEGTKQAANLWQANLSKYIVEKEGMTRSTIDPCLYTKFEDGAEIILIVWVDDLCIGTTTQQMFEDFFERFSKEYSSTKNKSPTFVGIDMKRDRSKKTITLNQTRYIEKLFDRFLSERNTKPWKTPSGTSREEAARFMNISPPTDDNGVHRMTGNDYLKLMGALLYAACMTRPDIAFHVSFLCRLMSTPSKEAYDAGLAVLSYLHQTKEMGLTYGGKSPCIDPDSNSHVQLIVHADSSFGQSPYPYGGGFVEFRGAAISWHSRRHKTPPQSTWEAELSVMIAMIKESIFAKNIGEDMKVKLETTHVLTDSKSAYDTVRNPGATKKSTHVERWLMFARDLYLTKAIGLTLVPTHRMMADGMTKVVDKDKFFKCRDYAMGIEENW